MTFGFFTARRYASAIYAVVVCLSVRLTQAGTAPKGYTRDHANNAISDVNISTKFQCDHPNRGRQIASIRSNCVFRPISRYISDMVQDRDILTMER